VTGIELCGPSTKDGRRVRKPRLGEDTVEVTDLLGLRDRCIVACLVYTAARAGAVAGLRRRDLTHGGSQWTLRFREKGGKSREIPVRHDLEQTLFGYLRAAGLDAAPGDAPLFPTAYRATDRLTDRALTGGDVCRLVKRRLRQLGLPDRLSPHSFRVATVTDLLGQGVALEDVAYLAGHADVRTTRLYDRRERRVTRNGPDRLRPEVVADGLDEC